MKQSLLANDALHGERGGTTDRMRIVGLPVLERARAAGHGAIDFARADDRADGLVAAAEPLPQGHDVGNDPVLLARKEGAGPAASAHHFVEDQQDAMTVADLPHVLEIGARRRDRAGSRADDGLSDEGDDRLGAEPLDFLFERLGGSSAIGLGTLARLGETIFETGIGQRDVDEQRLVGRSPPGTSPGRERAERVAVIALAPSNDAASASVAAFEMILPRELQRRLDRFRAAAREPDAVERARRHFGHQRCQLFRRIGREEAGVDEFEALRLLDDGGGDFGMAVAKARNGRSPAGVDVPAPIGIEQGDAFPANRNGRTSTGRPMKDVLSGHRPAAFAL